ncbi:hypothetical protein FAI40_10130 [Acetobacteraceae bacterium]|nr:hypothetical protein FAI40_10130 [Acetobacteraceae bacterium]
MKRFKQSKKTAAERKVTAHLMPDNKPTPERLLKEDYEKIGGKFLRSNTVSELERRGVISGDAVTAAKRWLVDFIFATEGYADFLKEPLSDEAKEEIEKYGYGNVVTFNLARAKASSKLLDVKRALGECSHRRLVLLLGEQISFTAIGRRLFPFSCPTRQRDKASIECAYILEQLAEFYGYKKPIEAFHLKP